MEIYTGSLAIEVAKVDNADIRADDYSIKYISDLMYVELYFC